jgi:hypothetical protein
MNVRQKIRESLLCGRGVRWLHQIVLDTVQAVRARPINLLLTIWAFHIQRTQLRTGRRAAPKSAPETFRDRAHEAHCSRPGQKSKHNNKKFPYPHLTTHKPKKQTSIPKRTNVSENES